MQHYDEGSSGGVGAPASCRDDAFALTVNGRTYGWPRRPTVVVCFDGCDPDYVKAAQAAGVIPTLSGMMRDGFSGIADCVIPAFTNPNNISIVCGAPPAVHGVAGNYYLDRETGEDVMMVDARQLRAPTLLARFASAGASVVAITARDKLRKALGHELAGIAFSAERAAEATLAENGIEDVPGLVGRATPDPYSPDLSLFVLDAGICLMKTRRPDLLYLSLSDLVQHKHAPGTGEANDFFAEVDHRLGALLALGATVGVVADHGMSDMANADGTPCAVFLGDCLDEAYGAGRARVICPITDPFVRHHGALGGFVRIHLLDPSLESDAVLAFVAGLEGVELALPGAEAALRFDLPADREADIVAIGAEGVALGSHRSAHDLTGLAGERLRSHGSLHEQKVPFILSHPLNATYAARTTGLRNYDIYEFAINGVS